MNKEMWARYNTIERRRRTHTIQYARVATGVSARRPVAKTGKKKKQPKLHDTIARDIGVTIISGRYLPGDILSDEISSSKLLEVSRSAYREAIRTLAAKGLVESKPKIGTKVCAKNKWHMIDPDIIAWTFDGDPDPETVSGIFELRSVIEPEAAALAAERRSADQLATLIRAVDDMKKHTLATDTGQQADLDFHTNLLHASCNPYIISLVEVLGAAIVTSTVYKQRQRPLNRDPVTDHEQLLKAIIDKNPAEARSAMANLIRMARLDTPTDCRMAGETVSVDR